MTSTTPNVGLTVFNPTGDAEVNFIDWRDAIAEDVATSNMYLLDTKIGDMETDIDALILSSGIVRIPAIESSSNVYTASGITQITAYSENRVISLSVDTNNTGISTLNINSLGARQLMKYNSAGVIANLDENDLQANKIMLFLYDGTQWVWITAISSDQINVNGGTSGNLLSVNTDFTIRDSGYDPSDFAPAAEGVTNGNSHDHSGGDGAQISHTALSSIGTNTHAQIDTYISTTAPATFAPIAKGVTNGDTHDHSGGDGAQIAYSTLSGLPTLPSGTIVGTTDTQTLTNKRVSPRTGTTTSSATPTINTDNYDMYLITAQAEAIASFTTNLSGTPTEGQKLWIAITGTAARAITWGTSFEAGATSLPTTTVTTQRLDVGFVWNTVTSKWRCMASGSA